MPGIGAYRCDKSPKPGTPASVEPTQPKTPPPLSKFTGEKSPDQKTIVRRARRIYLARVLASLAAGAYVVLAVKEVILRRALARGHDGDLHALYGVNKT
jgi:hypothetical protein